MNRPVASNSSTGGAALARCASGIVAGLCKIQMWSWESTAIEDTSPNTHLLGIDGHAGSARNMGARELPGDCAPDVANAISSASTMVRSVEMYRFIAAHGITICEPGGLRWLNFAL